LASPSGHPNDRLLDEFERLAQALEEELATWRRRCMKAEAEGEEARQRSGAAVGDLAQLRQRIVELEAENRQLQERIEGAREQVEQLRTRLRFVEEQVAGDFG
jgi:chromosome segregation ATPase